MKKDDYLRLETGQVINFNKSSQKLTESDFKDSKSKELFNIFSNGDGVLDSKDITNLWNLAKRYSQKNNNSTIFDNDEIQKLLDKLINKDDKNIKIYQDDFTNFLLKVFQKQDKISLKDSAQLNVPFQEMKESNVNYKEHLNIKAERLFNPDNKPFKAEYYENKQLKSKTILGKDNLPDKAIYYDKDGEINRVEVKTETGWEITNFKPEEGDYEVIKTGSNKNLIKSETFYVANKTYKSIKYDLNGDGHKIEKTYDLVKNNNLSLITEYKDNKKYKITYFDKDENITHIEERIYNKINPQLLERINYYNSSGKLISYDDVKTDKQYTSDGVEIVQSNSPGYALNLQKIVNSLTENFTTENLKNINKDNILNKTDLFGYYNGVLSEYEAENTKLDSNKKIIKSSTIIDKILANPDSKDRKEQLRIIIEALRGNIDKQLESDSIASDKMLKDGKTKLIKLLDESMQENIGNDKIKNNLNLVIKILENPEIEFNAFAYADTPNGKIDKYSYQNGIGDCWLLSSLDAISELKDGATYLSQFIKNDAEKKEVTIKLMGGKIEYKFTYEEIQKAHNFSIGDYDMRAMEMAYDKYFKEHKPEGKDNIDGNWMKSAFSILSGNKPLDVIIQNDKAGVMINGKFIEINKNNKDKLKNIPIDIQNPTPSIIKQIKEIQEDTAITTYSDMDKYNNSAHAYYVTDISEYNNITVKEPHNPANSRTYTLDYYRKIYNNLTIFIK